jgi:hypothetical protein
MNRIYRGYDIEKKNGGYVISKDGKVECSQPSLEFAEHWIDGEKRRLAKLEASKPPWDAP